MCIANVGAELIREGLLDGAIRPSTRRPVRMEQSPLAIGRAPRACGKGVRKGRAEGEIVANGVGPKRGEVVFEG